MLIFSALTEPKPVTPGRCDDITQVRACSLVIALTENELAAVSAIAVIRALDNLMTIVLWFS
jgi:hypothetical protein